MLSNKIQLDIDILTETNILKISCVPHKWSGNNISDEPKRISLSHQMNDGIRLGELIPNADDSVMHAILDEILYELFEQDLKALIPEYISPDDPIYSHLMDRFGNNELRDKIYKAYFTEESLFELKKTLNKIIYKHEL